jgi:hypothetical protein
VLHDILRGIQTALVEGAKAGAYSFKEAGKATIKIAKEGPPLAKGGLGLAGATMVGPLTVVIGVKAFPYLLLEAPAIYQLLMRPIQGYPPLDAQWKAYRRTYDVTKEYYNNE